MSNRSTEKKEKMSSRSDYVCSVEVVDQQKVTHVNQVLPEKMVTRQMAEFFKSLSDPTRLRIVQALLEEELCVCDISAIVDISISAISHQLRLLRSMHIVKFRKQGKMVYYSLEDEHISRMLEIALEHLNEKANER